MSAEVTLSKRQTDGSLEPYAAIVELAERELELAGRGEVDALDLLAGEWEQLRGRLPDRPPLAAAALLRQAALIHERARVELLRLRESLLGELAKVAQGTRAAQGYAQPPGRRWQLDRRV